MSGTYSFQDVTATYLAPTGEVDLGYGSANAKEGISIARAGDKNSMTIGADGKGMHSLHADESGQVTARFLKTSPTNAKLMAHYLAQKTSAALWGKGVIVVRMSGVGDIHTCLQLAFKKVPNMEYANDGDTLEWVFDAVRIESLLGTY